MNLANSHTNSKLFLQPMQEVLLMLSLDIPTGITQSDMCARTLLETSSMLIQEVGQTGYQRPEANNRHGTHHLVVITTQEILIVLEENLDIPADSQDVDDGLGISIYQSAAPVAGPFHRFAHTESGDQQQGRTSLRIQVRTRCTYTVWPPCWEGQVASTQSSGPKDKW